MKSKAAALGNIQDFIYTISHQPCKWEDREHCHMTHDFWGKFGTYLGHHAKNKATVNFPRGKKIASKKGVMSRKVARTSTSTKDVSQIRLSDESYIPLTTFVLAERNQDETKEVLYQYEFINFKLMFQHKY